MSSARKQLRALKKEALQLQADSYRLQLAQDWETLRSPFKKGLAMRGLLGAFGSPHGFGDWAASLLSQGRFNWIARVLPLAMTGWRIAKLARRWFARADRDR
ncbi:hypothetical protein [Andreprevotia chitinilytica]|uniref:hypothetical protein n=1 Tax=Andreprevotia chitinilytica TaxID=396808 RepID=UPI000557DF96|nr:hypothetical protein [Andreprevotia chitinilytica]